MAAPQTPPLQDAEEIKPDECIDLKGLTVDRLSFGGKSLGDADLSCTLFLECDLRHADLSHVKGLLPLSFAGCDLRGASLPNTLRFDAPLATIQGAVGHARAVFLLIVAASFYCLLTVSATRDTDLLVNTASAPLPIIETPVPIAAFYAIAPVLLLASLIWMHAYLQRGWATIARLPARFPDGLTIDEHIDQWIPLSVGTGVSSWRIMTFGRLEAMLSAAVLWLVVPGTMLTMWARHLPRHDLAVSLWQIAVFAAGLYFSTVFAIRARRTIARRSVDRPLILRERAGGGIVAGLAAAALLPLTLAITNAAPDGTMGAKAVRYVEIAERIGLPHRLELSGANVAERPAEWSRALGGAELAAALAAVGRVELSGRNLDRAVADGAFFARARLEGASLRSLSAPLAFFVQANLVGADLQGAHLAFSDFRDADLAGATLLDADFNAANLRGACLSGANVISANFGRADLRGADLAASYGLNAEQLAEALCDETTRLPLDLSAEQCGASLSETARSEFIDRTASTEDTLVVPESCL